MLVLETTDFFSKITITKSPIKFKLAGSTQLKSILASVNKGKAVGLGVDLRQDKGKTLHLKWFDKAKIRASGSDDDLFLRITLDGAKGTFLHSRRPLSFRLCSLCMGFQPSHDRF